MDKDSFRQQLLIDYNQPFEGWDFSYINNRWDHGDKMPWDYSKIVKQYLQSADVLLDMGTGGGEFIQTLHHPYKLTYVTESYMPNCNLCKEILGSKGMHVKYVEDDKKLPLQNRFFDVVINRHESYDAKEVARIVKNGGYFITQQVGGDNDLDLAKKIYGEEHKSQFPNWNLANATKDLEFAFDIIYQEEVFNKVCFYDVGALVYFAKNIPWEFPGFEIDKYFEQLCNLSKELDEKGVIEGTEQRFIIVAKRKNDFD